MIFAENNQFIVVITFAQYYDSTMNTTGDKGNYQCENEILSSRCSAANFLRATCLGTGKFGPLN